MRPELFFRTTHAKRIILASFLFVFFFIYAPQAVKAGLDTYFQDFNKISDGVTIDSQDSWRIFGGLETNAIVQTGVTPSGSGKSIGLLGASNITKIERPFLYGSLNPTWINFKVRPASSAQTPNVPSTGIGAVCFDYTGKVLAANGASWVDTGITYTLGQWYDVTMKIDFNNHAYDLYLSNVTSPSQDFVPIKSGLDFIDPAKNSLSDLKFHGTYLASGKSNTYIDDVSVNYINSLEITTLPQRLSQGQISSPITVQLQDSLSSPQTSPQDIILELKSSSNKGKFSASLNPWIDVDQIVLPMYSQQITFYYKDTAAGKPIITISEYPDKGYLDAIQEFEILNKTSRFDFEVITPQVAGSNFDIKLTAKDEKGGIDELYSGTVRLSVNYISPSSGKLSIVPDILTGFTKGIVKMNAIYADCGLVTITALDDKDSDQIGTSSQILFLPASFDVSAESPQTCSKPFNLMLKAKNTQGDLTPNYNGSVNLSPIAVNPKDISQALLSPVQLAGSDFSNGIANAQVSYNLYGTIKLKAESSVDATKSGISNEIAFFPDKVSVNFTPPVGRNFFYVSEPIDVVVKVEDALGNAIPNYPGVIEMSSGLGLSLPGPYTLTGDDAGKRTFSINSTQAGTYVVNSRIQNTNLSAASSDIIVKDATIQVSDTTSPIGTGEITIRLLDDKGKVITSESNLAINVQALEEIEDNSVALPSAPLTFKEGKITVPITDTQAETVTIIPSSAYKLKINKGKIIFGRAGKTGVSQLMWRELKKK